MNFKILITGGACAGKTETIKNIKSKYEKEDYNIFVLKEVPTYLINNHITAENIGNKQFIKLVIKIYLELEKIYDNILKKYNKSILIYDSSPLDTLKFIDRSEFDEIVQEYKTSFQEIINNYNKIIFLETVAKSYPEAYTTENNKARLNNIEKAIERNDRLFKYYENHCDYIKGCKKINEKNKKVIKIIDDCLLKLIKSQI